MSVELDGRQPVRLFSAKFVIVQEEGSDEGCSGTQNTEDTTHLIGWHWGLSGQLGPKPLLLIEQQTLVAAVLKNFVL